MKTQLALAALWGLTIAASPATPDDGSVLPFPPTPSASKAGAPVKKLELAGGKPYSGNAADKFVEAKLFDLAPLH